MGVGKALFLWMTCHLLQLKAHSKCPPSFPCKNYTLQFPFTEINEPGCGLFPVDGCDSQYEDPRVHIASGPFVPFIDIDILEQKSESMFLVKDLFFQSLLDHRSCSVLSDMPLTNSPFVSFTISPNLTLLPCLRNSHSETTAAEHFKNYCKKECEDFIVYYNPSTNDTLGETSGIPSGCSIVQLPKSNVNDSDDLFELLSAEFVVKWSVSKDCADCYNGGGQCLADNQNLFYCKQGANTSRTSRPNVDTLAGANTSRLKLILALSISGIGFLLLLSITYIIWQRKKNPIRGYIRSRNIFSSKSDIEGGIFYFGIPVFSYTELEEATNRFDPSKELGDGGFGTVYHGNLRDGREVAIKRMYEHNLKRVEQFLNEIKILSAMRHPNLVSLYGCTSRTSRELLLVYEYISNGMVADHLHGERANEAPLTWPIRMNIAIETATALAYLHKSDIIHHDVKTNNILLDKNYSVKVADFGISRLFPNDVTHISTAPQGTPGYVDPEYHQCYQLTDKSDVYSFGVVLIELISSMPAVDVTRDRHEINLANLALNRIQRCAFDELIDSSLGYDSDPEVTRMTTMVAELSFRCLQVDKDLRPSMDEVVDFLKDIKGGEDCEFEQRKQGNVIHTSPETDDVFLLKNRDFHSSPMAIADAWPSSASTFTSSVE